VKDKVMVVKNKPWWWPKSHRDVDKLLDRIERHKNNYVLFMIDRAVVFATGCFFAFGMSVAFATLMLIIGKEPSGWNRVTLLGSCLIGGLCALIAQRVDHDVFREMSEVFLGIPLSRRTRSQLADEFGIHL